MRERGNAEVFFAIVLSILAFIGMAWLGWQGIPDKNGSIVPLFPTPRLFWKFTATLPSMDKTPSRTFKKFVRVFSLGAGVW